MTHSEKYEFIVCENLFYSRSGISNVTNYFIRRTETMSNDDNIITYSQVSNSPSWCFNKKNVPNIPPENVFYENSEFLTNKEIVAEAQSLEKLKLELPEYLI
jgi:hypothetical protein